MPLAPRIDPRLRRFIADADFFASPAEVTRQVGELAWRLGLQRPSYEQVRFLLGGRNRPYEPVQTSRGRLVLHYAAVAADFLYQYPGPGLDDWYRRYKRGLL